MKMHKKFRLTQVSARTNITKKPNPTQRKHIWKKLLAKLTIIGRVYNSSLILNSVTIEVKMWIEDKYVWQSAQEN